MAMAVGQPIIIMKNSCKAAIFIAKRSVGNKNGYGRRPANNYYEKQQQSGYFLFRTATPAFVQSFSVSMLTYRVAFQNITCSGNWFFNHRLSGGHQIRALQLPLIINAYRERDGQNKQKDSDR